jgi:hypothetical protein
LKELQNRVWETEEKWRNYKVRLGERKKIEGKRKTATGIGKTAAEMEPSQGSLESLNQ